MSNENFDQNSGSVPAGNDPYAQAAQPVQPAQPVSPEVAHAAIGAQAAQAAHAPQYSVPGATAPVAPAPAKKKGSKLGTLLGILVALLLAFGGTMWNHFKEADIMKNGNCVTVTKGASDKDDTPAKVDCKDTSKPTFTVVEKLTSGKCGDSYLPFEYVDKKANDKALRTYCLMPNLKADTCYKYQETAGQLVGFVPVACTDSSAEAKITKVIEGVADEKQCGNDKGLVYDKDPKRTYCGTQPN